MRRGGLLSAAVLGAAGMLLLAGCSTGGSSDRLTADGGGVSDAASMAEIAEAVMVGELSSLDGRIEVGEEISVMVELPDGAWQVTNSDESVVGVERRAGAEGITIVGLTGKAPGEALVEFTSNDGEHDSIVITVAEA